MVGRGAVGRVGVGLLLVVFVLSLLPVAVVEAAGAQVEPPPGPYGQRVADDGAIAHWSLDEASPTLAAADAIGDADGTYDPSVALGLPGAIATGTSATATATPVLEAPAAALPSGLTDRTVELWVSPAGTGDWVVRYGDTFGVRLTDPRTLAVVVGTEPADGVPVTLPYDVVGGWHHLAVSLTGGRATVVLDGQVVAAVAVPAAATIPGQPLVLGGVPGGYDELAVYPSAMAADALRGHRDVGVGATCPPSPAPGTGTGTGVAAADPIGWWSLDVSEAVLLDRAAACRHGAVGAASPSPAVAPHPDDPAALHADVEGQWAAVLDATGHPSGTAPRSLTLWTQLDPSGTEVRALVAWGDGLTLQSRFGTSLELVVDGAVVASGDLPVALSDGSGHHLAVTYDGDRLVAFADGTPVAEADGVDLGPVDPDAGLRVGGTLGRFDELATYDTALAQRIVAEQWVRGTTGTADPCGDAERDAYAQVVRADGPSGWWRLGERVADPAATVAIDASGACRPARLVAGSGVADGALLDDGDDGGLADPDVHVPLAGLPVDGPFTLELWSQGWSRTIQVGELFRWLNTTSLDLVWSPGEARPTAEVAMDRADGYGWRDEPDVWHHQALTYDGAGGWAVYVDGLPVATHQGTVLDLGRGGEVLRVTSPYAVDELAVYAGVLSVDAIRAHWTVGASRLGVACPGPSASGHAQAVLGDGPAHLWRLGEEGSDPEADVAVDLAGCWNQPYGPESDWLGRDQTAPIAGALAGDPDAALGQGLTIGPRRDLEDPWSAEAWVHGEEWGAFGHLGIGAVAAVTTDVDGQQVSGLQLCGEDCAVVPGMPIQQRGWHHLVLTHQGGQLTLFVDGVLHASLEGSAASAAEPQGSRLTVSGAGVDEVAMFDRALTAEEVAAHHAAGLLVETSTTLDGPDGPWVGPTSFAAEVRSGDGSEVTGEVTFLDGDAVLATVALDGSGRAAAVLDLSAGPHEIRARFSGTSTHVASTSPPLARLAGPTVSTSLALATSTNPSVATQDVAFTATVTPAEPEGERPTGFVTFWLDGTVVASRPLPATGPLDVRWVARNLAGGTHRVEARFGGDGRHHSSRAPVVDQVVDRAPTAVAPGITASVVEWGVPVEARPVVTALSPTDRPATGFVSLEADGAEVDRGEIAAPGWWQEALVAADLDLGDHVLEVAYEGDRDHADSRSGPVAVTVVSRATEVRMDVPDVPLAAGEPSTFTVVVGPLTPQRAPEGSVEVRVDGQPVGEPLVLASVERWTDCGDGAQCLAGVEAEAALELDGLEVGSHVVELVYVPVDDRFLPTSTTRQVEAAPPSSVELSVDRTTVLRNEPVTFTATVTTVGGPPVVGVDIHRVWPDGEISPWPDVQGLPLDAFGQASWVAEDLPAGPRTYVARYPGAPGQAPATSSPVTVTVERFASSVSLSLDRSVVAVDQSVRFTATVTALQPATVDGYVTVYEEAGEPGVDDDVVVTSINLPQRANQSTASVSRSFSQGGARRVYAVFGGTEDLAPATSSPSRDLVVAPATEVELTTTPTPSSVGEPVTITATVRALDAVAGTPTGTVTFFVDGISRATVPVDPAGVATWAATGLGAGPHTVAASFSSTVYSPSSAVVEHRVGTVDTSISLDVEPSPATYGAVVRLVATVTTPTPGVVPSGFVTFRDGSTLLGTAALVGGTAELQRIDLGVGVHQLTASFGGTDGLAPSATGPVELTVERAPTTVVVAPDVDPVSVGQPVTVTARVLPAYALPGSLGGTVVFTLDGADVAAVVADASGRGTWTTSFPRTGSHVVSARFLGSTTLAPSASGTTTLHVGDPTSLALTPTGPTTFGQPASFAVVVAGTSAPGVPTGEVSLSLADGRLLTTAELVDGTTTLSSDLLPAGEHELVLRYLGDDAFGPSERSVTHTVNRATPTVVVDASAMTTAEGSPARFTATVTGPAPEVRRPIGMVTFAADGVPIATGWLSAPTGQASVEVADLPRGTHQITASYGGDADHEPATSEGITHEVVAPLDASFTAGPRQGTAPLPVTFSATGEGNPPSATYTWSFGDGTTAEGPTVVHAYPEPGWYRPTLVVARGEVRSSSSTTVAVAEDVPLAARAGGDVVTPESTPVTFDGRPSSPTHGIERYRWDFGDGTTALGAVQSHSYAVSGTYAATLTVERDGETSTDHRTVTVVDPDGPGLLVTVLGEGGAPLGGADVVVFDHGAGRHSARTDGDGRARILGLGDGTATAFVAAPGYQPASQVVTLTGGSGQATVALVAGEVAVTRLDVRQLSYDEIVAAGIDPNAPGNQVVYANEIHLALASRPFTATYYTNGGGGSAGGGGGGGGSWGWDWDGDGDDDYEVSAESDDRIIQWLVVPASTRYLKEFFQVDLFVTATVPAGFTLVDGQAVLDLPGGVSLADTAAPQSPVVDLPDLVGGQTGHASWIVQGDESGDHVIAADYSAVLDPTGTPVHLRAETATPLRVWGAEALRFVVEADDSASAGRPYRVRLGLQNVADATAYNARLEVGPSPSGQFIYQPQQRTGWTAPSIAPGATFWTDEIILFPTISGSLSVEDSFVKKTLGDDAGPDEFRAYEADPDGDIVEPYPQPMGDIILAWEAHGASPGGSTEVDRYEVYRTSSRTSPFGSSPVAVIEPEQLTQRPSTVDEGADAWVWFSATRPEDPAKGIVRLAVGPGDTGLFTVRTVFADGGAGARHALTEGSAGEETTVSQDVEVDCRTGGTSILIQAEDPYDAPDRYRIVRLEPRAIQDDLSVPPDDALAEEYFAVIEEGSISGGSATQPLDPADFPPPEQADSDDPFDRAQMMVVYVQVSNDHDERWSTPRSALVFKSCYFEGEGGEHKPIPASQTMGDGCESREYIGSAIRTGAPGYDPYQCRVDPVNTATGALYVRAVDAALTAPGPPLRFERSYNSNDSRSGSLGQGWTSSWDIRLTHRPALGQVEVREADGQRLLFVEEPDGTLVSPPGLRVDLERADDGTWTLRFRDRSSYRFRADGTLAAIVDHNGQQLTVEVDAAGRVATATDAAGHTATLRYDGAGLRVGLDLPGGLSVAYGYTDGRLSSVTDVTGGTTTYTYDAAGRLAREVDPNGHTVHQTTYGADGRVVEQLDPLGHRSTFTWDPVTETSVMTDARGGTWTDRYEGNVLVATEDPLGNRRQYTYDEQLNRIAEVDETGALWAYAYDERGRLVAKRAPEPLGHQATWTYDEHDQVVAQTDALGQTRTFEYDERGNLLAVTVPGRGTTRFEHDARGIPTAVVDPAGRRTAYELDAAGNVVATTDPVGARTTFTYDALGRLTSVTSPRGNEPGADPAAFTKTVAYDAAGRVVEVREANGAVQTFAYDAAGNRVRTTDPGGRQVVATFDAADEVVAIAEAGRPPVTYEYDAAGNLTASTTPEGHRTEHRYDLAGRPVGVVDANGNVWRNELDGRGDVIAAIDPLGNRSEVVRDVVGRPVAVTDAEGRTTTMAYDALGRQVRTTDPAGATSVVAYDERGLPVRTVDALGGERTMAYDALGRLTSSTSATGATTTWEYDLAGQLASIVGPRGNVPGVDPDEHRVRYEYDADGNPVAVVDPLGRRTTSTYDPVGLPTSVVDATGAATTYGYDAANRLTSVTTPDGATTRYEIDVVGDLVAMTDPNGGVWRAAYDLDHRKTATTGPTGARWEMAYDGVGNQTAVVDAIAAAAGDPAAGTTTFAYDARSLLVGIDHSRADTADVAFTYDRSGQRTSMTDDLGTQEIERDERGLLVGVSRDGVGFTYQRDALGRVVERRAPGGDPVAYDLDADGRIVGVTASTGTVAYAYDPAGVYQGATFPNGIEETATYDAGGQLTELSATGPAGPATRTTRTYDGAGMPETQTTLLGETTYTYDLRHRLVGACASAAGCDGPAAAEAYAYDLTGNLTGRSSAEGTTAFGHDAAGRLVSATGPEPAAFTHDANGNLTSDGTRTFTYDQVGRLTAVTVPGTGGPSDAYAEVVAGDGPAGWWRLGDAPGSTRLVDASGGGADGTLPASTAPTFGVGGAVVPDDGAARFDGVDDKVRFPSSSATRLGTRFTIELWLRAEGPVGTSQVLAKQGDGGLPLLGWELRRDAAGRIELRRDGRRIATQSVPDAGWHHLAVTYDGEQVRWYVDGELDSTTSVSFFLPNLNILSPLVVGGGAAVDVDELALHGRALGADRVAARALAVDGYDAVVAADGPSAWWRFGEAHGARVVVDASGNGNDGTVAASAVPELGVAGALAAGGDDDAAVAFDGADDRATLPGAPFAALSGAGPAALELWLSADEAPAADHRVVDAGDPSVAGGGWELWRRADGRLELRRDGQRFPTASVVGSGDGWHHVVLGTDGAGTVRWWVDGRPDSSVGASLTAASPGSVVLGGAGTAVAIDEVATYTGALDSAAVAEHHAAGVGAGGGSSTPAVEVSYRYDGAGALVSRTQDGTTTTYEWDQSWGLPQLAVESVEGGDTRHYTWGRGPVSVAGDDGTFWYHTDALGSPAALTDATGDVRWQREWGPWGEPATTRVEGGPAPVQALGFTAGLADEPAGLVHLHARAYDPALGRFLQTDPLSRPVGTPFGTPYSYTDNMPTALVDPSGLMGQMGYHQQRANACSANGGNVYEVETNGCFHYDACTSDAWWALGWAIEQSCEHGDDIARIAEFVLTLLPGYDCVQTFIDPNALNAGLCLVDVVPGVGKVDEVVSVGWRAASGYDDLLAGLARQGDNLSDASDVARAPRTLGSSVDDLSSTACRAGLTARSFGADTPVLMADGSRKRIADVQVGDQVLATDPETGETGTRAVLATLPHTDQLLSLHTSSGDIVTTEDHLYWNATDQQWQESQDLDTGDRLLSADGSEVFVERLNWTSAHAGDAYDLTIDDLHTFFVGAGDEAILVHNANPCLRVLYEGEVTALSETAAVMRSAGHSSEEIARALNAERRSIGVKYKNLTPEPLRSEIYARNIEKYGDPLGPTIDWLRARGKSWDDIIESASRPGGEDLGF